MNIERNTPELLIKALFSSENVYMRFDKSDPNYKENAEQIVSLCKSCEASTLTVDEENENANDKYIFIRLYDPTYKGITAATFLKRGVKMTEVNKIDSSHAAINWNLKDGFYGLTLKKEQDAFNKEFCVTPESNEYMATCDANKSTCRVYYIKCSPQEYTRTKNMIVNLARQHKLVYDVAYNFIISLNCIKRKFFTKKDKRLLGRESAEIMSYESAKKEMEPIPTKFVCSTLVAYILYSTISKVKNWFNNHNVNYKKVTPSDLSVIRGMKQAFFCKWSDYNKVAKEFAEKHPEFKEYL